MPIVVLNPKQVQKASQISVANRRLFAQWVLRQEFVEEFNAGDFVAKLRTVTSGAVCRAAMKHRQAAVADSRLIRYSVLAGSTSFNPASQA
ncbi:hypothetical protein [Mesorhizobium muleiense]|uniref:hypothetical protein n=1 Tax=Mesorhizobium muleiense TaxID=1004279 RepID=UPI0011133134|nr:hypothetical protein [Mesorhizobium muleiense]MCF6103609.1 hypothetical protein [Mesorhizobium muleiense]